MDNPLKSLILIMIVIVLHLLRKSVAFLTLKLKRSRKLEELKGKEAMEDCDGKLLFHFFSCFPLKAFKTTLWWFNLAMACCVCVCVCVRAAGSLLIK